MKTLDPTLLAAQAPGAGEPLARASLADNGWLHLETLFTPTLQGNEHILGVNCGGSFFVRSRARSSPDFDLAVQVITDPTDEDQWTTWTDFGVSIVTGAGTALFWTGTYVVLAWQSAADLDVYYARSTDGLTWSSAAKAYTYAAAVSLAGASGGSAQSGLFIATGAQLYWAAYNPAANTWASADSAGLAFTTAAPTLAAAYDSTNSRHLIAIAASGLTKTARNGLHFLTRTTAGAWSTPRFYYASDQLGISHMSLSQAPIHGYWWLSFFRYTTWGRTTFWLARSDDGLAWQDGLYTDIQAQPRLPILGELTGYTGVWLGGAAAIARAAPHTFWSNRTVYTYHLDHRPHAPEPRLSVTVDNRDGGATAPELFSVLTLERGYHLAGTDYYVSAGTFHVIGYRYQQDDALLEVFATDAFGLLRAWYTDTAYTQFSQTVQTIIEHLCARAGVHQVSFDASALWSETIAIFTLAAGASAWAGLESLQRRVPFAMRLEEDGALYFYVPTAGPSAAYTYGRGSGEHVFWPGAFGTGVTFGAGNPFGAAAAPAYVLVRPADPLNHSAEAADSNAQHAAGWRRLALIDDRRVVGQADAQALANAHLVALTEQQRAGDFQSPPNFALELGDVVALDQGLWADAYTWRVIGIHEHFNAPNYSRKFYQHVFLQGTA